MCQPGLRDGTNWIWRQRGHWRLLARRNGLVDRDGVLTHAVEEVTIAGNLADMLRNVTAIGNDLEFRGASGFAYAAD